MLGMTNIAEHLRRRRPWARAFSGAALKEYEPMVASRALQLVQVLQSQKGEVDIGKWVNYHRLVASSVTKIASILLMCNFLS